MKKGERIKSATKKPVIVKKPRKVLPVNIDSLIQEHQKTSKQPNRINKLKIVRK